MTDLWKSTLETGCHGCHSTYWKQTISTTLWSIVVTKPFGACGLQNSSGSCKEILDLSLMIRLLIEQQLLFKDKIKALISKNK